MRIFKLVSAVIAFLGLASAAVWWGLARQAATVAEQEVGAVLVGLGDSIARCAAASGLPPSALPVPARLAEVSGKAYNSRSADWAHRAYTCGRFVPPREQRLQYLWQKTDKRQGRATAIGDLDADGVADTWYEVVVSCQQKDCRARNYAVEVLEDGTRLPPLLLRLTGRDSSYVDVPPPHSPLSAALPDEPHGALPDDGQDGPANAGSDDTHAGSPAPSAAAPSQPLVLPKRFTGGPAKLDALFFELQREATALDPAVVLLTFDVEEFSGVVVDPGAGGSARAVFGAADGAGQAPAGEVVTVSYGTAGVVAKKERSDVARKMVSFANCFPERALRGVASGPVNVLSLAWDAGWQKPVWTRIQAGDQQTISALSCAYIK